MKIILNIFTILMVLIIGLGFVDSKILIVALTCILPFYTILLSSYFFIKKGWGYLKSLFVSIIISIFAFLIFMFHSKLNPLFGEENLQYVILFFVLISTIIVSAIVNSIIILMIKSKNKIDKLIS